MRAPPKYKQQIHMDIKRNLLVMDLILRGMLDLFNVHEGEKPKFANLITSIVSHIIFFG